MQRWFLCFILLSLLSCEAFAVETPSRTLTINAELSASTCGLSLSPASIDFQQVSLNQLEQNATTSQKVSLNISCSWPTSGISIKFSPTAGVAESDAKIMKTNIQGVGLALFWKEEGTPDFVPQDFNTTFSPVVTTLSERSTTLGQFMLLPKRILGETLHAGNVNTSLTVEVTYD